MLPVHCPAPRKARGSSSRRSSWQRASECFSFPTDGGDARSMLPAIVLMARPNIPWHHKIEVVLVQSIKSREKTHSSGLRWYLGLLKWWDTWLTNGFSDTHWFCISFSECPLILSESCAAFWCWLCHQRPKCLGSVLQAPADGERSSKRRGRP